MSDIIGSIKRYEEHPDGGMREDELGAYVRFEDHSEEMRILGLQEDRLRAFIKDLQESLDTPANLLEALKIAREYMNQCYGSSYEGENPYPIIDAAIAKAEGKS